MDKQFKIEVQPNVIVFLIFWVIVSPFVAYFIAYDRGVEAGKHRIADLCWTFRGFAQDKGNTRYFFDCKKTRETVISPWEK